MSVVIFEKRGRTGYFTLNRPEKLNTVSRELARELLDKLHEFEHDDSLWVGIITGSGEKSFSAGADLTDAEIEAYLLAEKPYDCAGSAKSEGLGIALLDSIENDDPTALVGLPLIRTSRMLREAGIALLHTGSQTTL